MKTLQSLLLIITFMATMAIMPAAEAQVSAPGTFVGATDTQVALYSPKAVGDATSITVGVDYTKAATEDSLSTFEVYQALDQSVITAGRATKISTDANLMYNSGTAAEYEETTITLTGCPCWIQVKSNMVGTATDTVTYKPYILFTRPSN